MAVGAGVRGDDAHLGDVVVESLATFFGEGADGEGIFAFEGFFDGEVAGFFEFGEVAGEIALSEAALALEVQEIGFVDGVRSPTCIPKMPSLPALQTALRTAP